MCNPYEKYRRAGKPYTKPIYNEICTLFKDDKNLLQVYTAMCGKEYVCGFHIEAGKTKKDMKLTAEHGVFVTRNEALLWVCGYILTNAEKAGLIDHAKNALIVKIGQISQTTIF